jgi:MSHA pilin protein MshD
MNRPGAFANLWRRRPAGFTFVELIVSIVVISVGLAGVLMVMNLTVQRSADPMIQQQASAIAEAYLEEIMARPFSGDSNPGDARETLDNVQAYDGLPDNLPRDQFGDPMPGVGDYSVSISVGPGTIGGVGGADALRIDVSVSHPSGVDIRISGYRLDY